MREFGKQKIELLNWIDNHIEIEEDAETETLNSLRTKISVLMPKAKQLKWEFIDWAYFAGIFGEYRIEDNESIGFILYFMTSLGTTRNILDKTKTLKEAKQAAQEHYNSIVLEQIA